MSQRQLSTADRYLRELDAALRVVFARSHATVPTPGRGSTEHLSDTDKALGSRLMRVNHSGEIAAQALYRGQALVARDPELRSSLIEAAEEEHDHLAWCEQRADELGGSVSKLAPLWYSGSFAIGVLAGLAGDRVSLGFLAETEKQVTEHLEGHLERLPGGDTDSRAIISQMREDEIRHGQGALERGGMELPAPVRGLMRLTARFMTGISYRL